MLKVVALGGLGEIGLNCMLIEHDGDFIMVDCGVTFPDSSLPGVELIVPDFSYVHSIADKIKGIFLTHGHEDHITALSYLFKEIEYRHIPVYGTNFTLCLLEKRLSEHGYKDVQLHEVEAGQRIQHKPFEVEFIHVTHSIIDAAAMAIRTPAGCMVHSGDFKIDYHPLDKRPIDLERFKEIGDEGVLALFSDSTNSECPGHSLEEEEVGKTLQILFKRIKGKIILTTFSSHIHRIQQVIDVAHSYGRKVALAGRSVRTNVHIALDEGYLKTPPGILIDEHDVADLPSDQVVILSTGCQGEPRSMLPRIANDMHRTIKLEADDCVIFSARFIPGNEVNIYSMINQLHYSGAEVIYQNEPPVHASGHAKQDEQSKLVELVKPKYFVPIHGEYRHLAQHAKLAERSGAKEAIVALNGDIIAMDKSNISIVGEVPTGRTYIAKGSYMEVNDACIAERKRMAYNGAIVVQVQDRKARLQFQGIPKSEQNLAIPALKREIEKYLTERNHTIKQNQAEEKIQAIIKRYFKRKWDKRPLVTIVN